MRRVMDVVLNTITILLLLVAVWSLARPGAPVRSTVAQWWRRERQPALIRTLWPELTPTGARLDSGLGPVRLVEFADFQCPYCAQDSKEITKFLASHPDVGVVYRHLPLPIHSAAQGAARAGVCAERQGAFQRLQAYFFETNAWVADTDWMKAARIARIPDVRQFRLCLNSVATAARLRLDRSLAESLGVRVTPTFVSERQVAPGMQSDSALESLLGLTPGHGRQGPHGLKASQRP